MCCQMRVLIDWSVSMKKCISSIFLSGSRKNFRQYCKPSTTSRVLITVSNSPNFPRVWMRLRKHGKSPLLHNCLIAVIPVEPAGKASLFHSYKQTSLMSQYNGKLRISLSYVSNPVLTIRTIYLIFCVAGGPMESFSMRYSPWVGTL